MDDWSLVYDGFDPAQEGHLEALCTLGNGYFATRGAAEESFADEIHYPGTYIAGCYNRLDTTIAGRTITNEDLVNCPNWLPLTFRVGDDDRWFNLQGADILDYRQELDLKGRLLISGFIDPHVHLDIALMNPWFQPGRQEEFHLLSDLNEAIEHRRTAFTQQDIERRAGAAL